MGMTDSRSDGGLMQIATERLILRDFRNDDWPSMLAYWRDPLYQRYNPDFDDPERFVRELVSAFVAQQAERPRRKWQLAIVDPADGRLIGNCGIRFNNPQTRDANIGYELDS